MERDAYLVQIKLPDHRLLILTCAEFTKALRRGDSVIHNCTRTQKKPDPKIVEAEGISYV